MLKLISSIMLFISGLVFGIVSTTIYSIITGIAFMMVRAIDLIPARYLPEDKELPNNH